MNPGATNQAGCVDQRAAFKGYGRDRSDASAAYPHPAHSIELGLRIDDSPVPDGNVPRLGETVPASNSSKNTLGRLYPLSKRGGKVTPSSISRRDKRHATRVLIERAASPASPRAVALTLAIRVRSRRGESRRSPVRVAWARVAVGIEEPHAGANPDPVSFAPRARCRSRSRAGPRRGVGRGLSCSPGLPAGT